MNNPILILQIVRSYSIHGKKGRVYQYTEHVVNVHPCVVKLSKFKNVLQSHWQEWTDQPWRPRWEYLQVSVPRLVHQSIHINVFMSFHNHQEWGHKLFLACNRPWRAGFYLWLCHQWPSPFWEMGYYYDKSKSKRKRAKPPWHNFFIFLWVFLSTSKCLKWLSDLKITKVNIGCICRLYSVESPFSIVYSNLNWVDDTCAAQGEGGEAGGDW